MKKNVKQSRKLELIKVIDQARQKLILIALEPEWEAKFKQNSYEFRPSQNPHQAITAVFNSLRSASNERRNFRKYVLSVELDKSFDEISHTSLVVNLKTIPKISDQIKF